MRSEVITTETEDVIMRLSPTPTSVETTQSRPLSPKVRTQNSASPTNNPLLDRRATLLRHSSFVKLRNFCSIGRDAFPSTLLYLQTSSTALKTNIQQAVVQLEQCMLVLAVYLCIACLLCQVAAFGYALVGKAAPPGLVFMIGSAIVIMTMNAYLIKMPAKRESRERQSRRLMLTTSLLKKSQ